MKEVTNLTLDEDLKKFGTAYAKTNGKKGRKSLSALVDDLLEEKRHHVADSMRKKGVKS